MCGLSWLICVAVDIAPDKLQLALDCGADFALDSMKPGAAAEAQQTASTIVVSGAGAAYDFAFKVTQDHGRIIVLGVPHTDISFSPMTMVLRDISLIRELLAPFSLMFEGRLGIEVSCALLT